MALARQGATVEIEVEHAGQLEDLAETDLTELSFDIVRQLLAAGEITDEEYARAILGFDDDE